MPPVEIEVKYSVSGETDFRRILAVAGTLATVRSHLNCYLDGPQGELRRMGWMARVRLNDDDALLTLKGQAPGPTEPGVFLTVEIERNLSRPKVLAWVQKDGKAPVGLLDPGPDVPGEVRDLLASGRVSVQTWALTTRWTFRDQGGLELVADETWFPDGFRDFEIEVECRDIAAGQMRISEVSRSAGVLVHPQEMTKHARALLHVGNGPRLAPTYVVARSYGYRRR